METMEQQTLVEIEPQYSPPVNQTFEVGSWTGKAQAFAFAAHHSAGALAQSLKEIKETGYYQSLHLNWDEFCAQYVGICGSYADRLIGRLNEFGINYFRLSQIIHISPEVFRVLAPSISEDGEEIEIDGIGYELTPENAPAIRAAVKQMRERAHRLHEQWTATALRRRLNSVLEEMWRLANSPLATREVHESVLQLARHGSCKLDEIARRIPKF